MKKVLVWETLPIISGGQKITLIVTDMLNKTGEYKFVYLIPGKGPLADELDQRNIPYYIMGDQTLPTGVKSKTAIFRYARLSLKAITGFFKVAMKEKPDIIYTPGPAALPWGTICGILIGKPVIWHLHHIFLDGATKKLVNLFSSWESIRTIISVSDCVAGQITNKKAFSKKITLYNPVDIAKYAEGCGEVILHELAIKKKENTIILGHIALLQPSKRQDVVIAIVQELKRVGYDAHAFFVGQARKEDITYELRLKQIIKNEKLDECTHFLGHRTDVSDILQAIDVVIIPSLEGLPLVALEAMAGARPIVTITSGGSAELITASQAGYCFDENNIRQAVEMTLCAVNSSHSKSLTENGEKFVKNCSYENYSGKILEVFAGGL